MYYDIEMKYIADATKLANTIEQLEYDFLFFYFFVSLTLSWIRCEVVY